VRRAFSVAAVNVNGKRRPSANSGFNVALTAPGEHIHSLTAQKGKKDGVIAPMVPTTYHTLSGTSFSAPFVAGTASLLWAKYPQLTNQQIEAMLLNSAEDMDRTGWDRYNGAGLLNAGKALGSPTDDRLTVRFTEVFTNKRSSKIASLDVYGVVRGDLNSYVVEVGKGKKPGKWQQVFGPSNEPADYGLICRIDGKSLKSRESTVRITAKSKSGQTRTASFVVRKW
jgi:subtilisin family serine protease